MKTLLLILSILAVSSVSLADGTEFSEETSYAALNNPLQKIMLDAENKVLEQKRDERKEEGESEKTLALVDINEVNSPTDELNRLVEEVEMVQLNNEFRGKNKPTNVLSFPVEQDFFDLTQLISNDEEFDEYNLLGDIVICHSVIVKEAGEQAKSTADHYAHMVVHGILHLCGYDHIDDADAQEMESLEVEILAKHNVINPYS